MAKFFFEMSEKPKRPSDLLLEGKHPGEMIRAIREGVYQASRQTFAEWLGISQSALYNYEEGIRTPDVATCLKMTFLYPVRAITDFFWGQAGLSKLDIKRLRELAGMGLSARDKAAADPVLERAVPDYMQLVSESFASKEVSETERVILARTLYLMRNHVSNISGFIEDLILALDHKSMFDEVEADRKARRKKRHPK